MIKIITTVLLATSLNAVTFDNGIKLDINKDENNNIHPDIILPIKWNQTFSSSFEYKTDKTITQNETVANTTSGDKDTTIEHFLVRVGVLSYDIQNEDSKFYFGFGLQKENFDKTQIGFAQSGATNINFDHSIDIEVKSVYLQSDMIFYTKSIDTKLSLNVVPTSKLTVTQNTTLSDAVSSTGSGSSDETLNLSYEVGVNFISKTDSFVDFGVEGSYRFLPLKYDLQLANSDNTYTTQKYDVEEKITSITGKIYFNTKLFGSLKPTVGISSQNTKSLNKLDNKTLEEKETKILFGFNSRF